MDIGRQNEDVLPDIRRAWDEIIDSGAFVMGKEVDAFEHEYAAYCESAYCVGVGNGTDALELALRALGVRIGQECVLPANSFVATAEAVARLGAVPVLVDCDPDTLLIDASAARNSIIESTAAVIPVHLYGQMAPLEDLEEDVQRVGASIIEDAAQSQGASRNGIRAGAWGDAGATSFYPGKNLGAFGDAGAVTTNRPAVADAVRRLGNHGSRVKYEHASVGFNSRMDALQATVLRAKLARLDEWNALRQRVATRYLKWLKDFPGVRLPTVLEGNTHVWHLFVVRVPDRDEVLNRMRKSGVDCSIHYPSPIHLTPAFEHLGYSRGDFPHAEAAAREVLSLPMHPYLTANEQDRVVTALAGALS